MSDAILMLAVRAPVPGQTKTRLGLGIGMVEAARVYEGFLLDLGDRLVPQIRASGIDVAWTFSPPETDFEAELRRLRIDTANDVFVPQSGDSWAVRQDNLMRWASTQGYERSILIASDSPHLPASSVIDAFDLLETTDVVIGRVADGGYYLIGMCGFHDVLLTVPMSTAQAGDALVANAKALGKTISEAEPTFDIDTIEELGLLAAHLSPDGEPCPATWRRLQEYGLAG